MTQDLRLTVKAVLARFNGNKFDAMRYCIRTAAEYPHLAEEYQQIRRGLAVDTLGVRTHKATAGA